MSAKEPGAASDHRAKQFLMTATSCTTTPRDRLDAYLEAINRHDVEGALSHLADVQSQMGEYFEALLNQSRARDGLAAVAPRGDGHAESLRRLGDLYWRFGDYPRAEAEYSKALAIRQGPNAEVDRAITDSRRQLSES